MSKPERKTDESSNELVITRVFDAPLALVWRAWTDPEHVKRWWGPAGFTAPAATIDFREGGKYLFCMRSPEGQEFWSTGRYLTIEPQSLIECEDSFADERGNVVPASHYGMGDDFPLVMRVVLTFDALSDGTTRLTLRHIGLPAGELVEMTSAGWNQSLDKLAASLA